MRIVNSLLYSILAVFLMFTATPASAVECGNNALAKKAVHNLPGAGYWMQLAGDCRVTYTSIGGVFSKMYNFCERKPEPITNDIDAFALPEGDIYVHPNNGISFYKMSDALKDVNTTKPFYNDPKNFGNYESIGVLPGSTPEKRLIRIAMGNAAGTFRDYSVETKGKDDFTVTPIQDDVIPACKNLPSGGLDIEIPILSRDGQMIAARQQDSRKTEIFKILMPSGDCEPIAKIPTATSKVTFSYDNKNVFYVIRDPNTGKGRLMKMDIATGTAKTVSGPDEDILYVTAKRDGSIFYTRRTGQDRDSELVELSSDSFPDATDAKAYEALGMMWGAACGKPVDLDYAFAVGQRMDRAVCNSIVSEQNMSSLDQDHKSISIDKLKTACGSNAVSGGSSKSETGTK